MRIIAIIMAKNEETNITRSIDSIKTLDGLVLYDTGSTDKTIELSRELCEKYNIPFYLLQGEFEDFSKSRNKLIDYAQSLKISDWMVLLDANDELQNAEGLRKYLGNVSDLRIPLDDYIDAAVNNIALEEVARENRVVLDSEVVLKGKVVEALIKCPFEDAKNAALTNSPVIDTCVKNLVTSKNPVFKNIVITRDCIYLKQKWKTSAENYLEFKNHRCIRSDTTMRYIGVVHECLVDPPPPAGVASKVRINEILEDVIVYQDRLLDTTMSSERRWIRDKKLLQKEYNDKSKPLDFRTVFYYAQTCKCLGEGPLSKRLYEERYNLVGGFEEERYVSAYECGVHEYLNYLKEFTPPEMKNPDSKKDKLKLENAKKDYERNKEKSFENAREWFMKAFDHSPRAEPLMILGRHYFNIKKYYIAYMYVNMAIKIPIPTTTLLWYNKEIYDYERWHLHSLVSELNGFTDDAIASCQNAINAKNYENDIKNMAIFQQEKLRKSGV